ncbi:MAG: twin-arginine translocase TatA/TatE family subunit [Chloroflexota bacterium]|nr:twin-arginine translocase TatA/TatE family subunit [Chloroflexota bacterium]
MVGPLELTLIVIAIALVFGVGKLGDIGGALGRGIREFKQEVDAAKEPKQLEESEREV